MCNQIHVFYLCHVTHNGIYHYLLYSIWCAYTDVLLLVYAEVEPRNINASENQACRFELAIRVGHRGKERMIDLAEGTVLQKAWYPVSWVPIQHAHGS